MNVFSEQALKFLTPNSNLTEMLRAMYRTGVDYCVMLPSWNFKDYVIFTKDQLVLLIERDSPDIRVSDIPRLAAEGSFKPLIFSDKPAAPDSDVDAGELQVLIFEDEQAGLSSMKEALVSRDPDFPAWWEAPVPFVMHRRRRTYLNLAAEQMFGMDLEELPRDLPEKDEFLVNLQSGDIPRSLMFRRLEDDIFTLEDCTGDVLAAEDIAWWAAVGKAWISILDKGKRVYRRCERSEIEKMEAEELAALSAENTLIPCEWEGGVLGYLCVKKRAVKKDKAEKTKPEKAKTGRAGAQKLSRPDRKRTAEAKGKNRPAEEDAPEDESEANKALKILGPQAMGLLTPGVAFPVAGEREKNA